MKAARRLEGEMKKPATTPATVTEEVAQRVRDLIRLPIAWNEDGTSYGADLVIQHPTVLDHEGREVHPPLQELLPGLPRGTYRLTWPALNDPPHVHVKARALDELLRDATPRQDAWARVRPYLLLWFKQHPAEVAELLARPDDYDQLVLWAALCLLKFTDEQAQAIERFLMGRVIQPVLRKHPGQKKLHARLGLSHRRWDKTRRQWVTDATIVRYSRGDDEPDSLENEPANTDIDLEPTDDDSVDNVDDDSQNFLHPTASDVERELYVALVERALTDAAFVTQNVVGYLYRAAERCLIDLYRKACTGAHPELLQVWEADNGDDDDGAPETVDQVLSTRAWELARRPERDAAFEAVDATFDRDVCLSALTPRERQLAALLIADLPGTEIAARMGVTPARVSQLVKKLRTSPGVLRLARETGYIAEAMLARGDRHDEGGDLNGRADVAAA